MAIETTAEAGSVHPRRARGLDLSQPIIILVAVLLVGLIVLPMAWVVVHAFSVDGHPGLDNFVVIFSDPAFLGPLATTLMIASSVGLCLLYTSDAADE